MGSDRETRIAQIDKETGMDKGNLAGEHPELLAESRKDFRAKGRAEALAEAEKQAAAALGNQLALVKMVAGEAVAEKVAGLSQAGLTAEQVEALGLVGLQPVSPPAAETATDKEAAGRQEILAHLRQATPGPVAALPNVKEPNGMAAALDRSSALEQEAPP